MYKHAFSDTGDGYGFFLENLDDPYSLVMCYSLYWMYGWYMWWNQKVLNSSACHICSQSFFYDVSKHDNVDDGCKDEDV